MSALRQTMEFHHNINSELVIKRRQVGRIIRHLRDDMAKRQSRFCLPSEGLIDSLMQCCPDTMFTSDNWHKLVIESLAFLHEHTDSRYFSSNQFIDPRNQQNIFPSDDLFDELDCHRFCKSLLDYLEEDAYCGAH